tara:strand:+ start:99 stop:425 length:327 start_codon:yes stop_codon:yes gene_type:complete
MPNADDNVKLISGKPLTKLHFQFDVSSIEEPEYSRVDLAPFFEDMEKPTIVNGVKILQDKNEALLRCIFYAKSRSLHHRNFIYNYRDQINSTQIFDPMVWDAVNPIIS